MSKLIDRVGDYHLNVKTQDAFEAIDDYFGNPCIRIRLNDFCDGKRCGTLYLNGFTPEMLENLRSSIGDYLASKPPPPPFVDQISS